MLFVIAALLCALPALAKEYWRSEEAYLRTPYEYVPHGNFYNFLPPLPEDVRKSLPPQDGSIAWKYSILRRNKDLYERGHPMAVQLVRALINQANLVYDTFPITTVTEKEKTPPNGNKRYYMTVGPYYWPQPITPQNPTGEPYVRRDGIFNPELATLLPDNVWLRDCIAAVKWHALAFFFTGDRKFPEQARQRVYRFFLDPTTGMVPDLRFSQGIPGVVNGRAQGTIDMRHIGDLLDGLALIRRVDGSAWSDADDAAMRAWVTQYVDGYLLVHEHARTERASENNHGNYFDVQLISLLKYLGRDEAALQVAYYARHRPEKQVIDGVQPFEFVRPTSLHYLTFNTKALTRLAIVSESLGIDLWRHGLRHGFSIKDVYDFALPHLMTRGEFWPYKQVSDHFSFDRFGEVFGSVYSALVHPGTSVGPYAYLIMNNEFWTSDDFLARYRGNYFKQFLAESVFRVEADSDYALASLPEPPCEDLSCDTFAQTVLIVAGVLLAACLGCIGYNHLAYHMAERAPELPRELKELAAQQKRILLRDEELYIQQLAPKAYVSPLFTRGEPEDGKCNVNGL